MNCPSRTDQDTIINPDWNQSPPFLPADLTTREDLNGRVNDRQFKDGSGVSSSSLDSLGGIDVVLERSIDPPIPRPCACADAKFPRYRDEICSATQAPSLIRRFSRWCATHQHWLWWGTATSVLSFLVYYIGNLLSSYAQTPAFQHKAKRNSACQSKNGKGDYNTPLHIGSVFIILFLSFSACAFPMLVIKFPRLHIPSSFLFVVRHFGTGVLIATAFVHLLPTAFVSLGNPCLSAFWTNDYPAMPGAIALAAIFLVTVVEMVFSPAQHICGSSREVDQLVGTGQPPRRVEEAVDDAPSPEADPPGSNRTNSKRKLSRGYSQRDHDTLCGRTTSVGRGLARLSTAAEQSEAETIQNAPRPKNTIEEKTGEHVGTVILTPEQKRQKAVMQCVLLEVGILFHSVFIGMALSVSVGNEFVILLIAIAFHQTFEGLALGSRIATLSWDSSPSQPWLMALAYGCTTPIGQAIGLATHTLYDPESEAGLIMVGTMNAISSGLLVYASLVELLSEDFLSDESWQFLRGKRRVFACILVFLGAFGMSLIGAWA